MYITNRFTVDQTLAFNLIGKRIKAHYTQSEEKELYIIGIVTQLVDPIILGVATGEI